MRIRSIFAALILLVGIPSYAFGAEEQFTIGFTLPLSGPFAEFGAAVENAHQLAKEENPAMFNNARFIFEDDQYNPKNTLAAYQKLKNIDGAKLILTWGNEPALAIAPVAESESFPLLAFGQTPAIAASRQHVLRVLGPADEFGKPIAGYLNEQKISSIQMVLLENTFYRLVADSVHSGLHEGTAYNVIASVPAAETDFKTYLLKIKRNPKDSVGVFLAPAQLIPFFKQAHELRVTNLFFGSTSFESKAVASEARQLMEGSVYAHVAVDPAWHEKYLARFGNDIQVSYAAVAYDMILAILKVIPAQEGEASGHSVLEALSSLPKQRGASGEFFATSSAKDGRYINFDVALKKVVRGSVELVP